MSVLIGMSIAIKGKKHDLLQEESFIGRNPQNHIVVDDSSVSGRHCSILREDRKYTLVDLGSTNGTRLNGESVIKARLRPKDIIQVGGIEFMFDGQDVEIQETTASETTRIEVSPEPATESPVLSDSFHTASPFGTRRDSRKSWAIIISVLGFLVLLALVYFMKNIFES